VTCGTVLVPHSAVLCRTVPWLNAALCCGRVLYRTCTVAECHVTTSHGLQASQILSGIGVLLAAWALGIRMVLVEGLLASLGSRL
jgi:hypothetical protein